MKRITILLTILLLTAVVFAPKIGADTAHADDGETLVKMSGTSDSDGVYIDVVLLRNVGLTALKLRLEYDETALTYVRALNWNEALKGLAFTASGTDTEVDNVRFVYGPGSKNATTGMLMRLYFKLNDGAKAGTYKVNLVCEDALTSGNVDVPVAVQAARITVDGSSNVQIDTEEPFAIDGKTAGIVCACVAVVIVFVVLLAVKASKR